MLQLDRYLDILCAKCVVHVTRSTPQVYDCQSCVSYEQNKNGDLLGKPGLVTEIQLLTMSSLISIIH